MPPVIKHGNMLKEAFPKDNSILLVSASALINVSGQLVMREPYVAGLKSLLTNAPKKFGDVIGSNVRIYGVRTLKCTRADNFEVGIFQTKYQPSQVAELSLISSSVKALLALLTTRITASERRGLPLEVNMNYPGIETEGLTETMVWPIIEHLPELVNVWKTRT
jgi:hypothetical protein